MLDFICKWLGDNFGSPCDYSTNTDDISEFMFTHCGKWCDEHCVVVEEKHCWKKFFIELKKESDNEKNQNKRN